MQPATFDAICLGETVIDLISTEIGTLDEVTTFVRYLGGAPINVAATIARLGRRAQIATRVGDDAMGRFACREFRRLNLDDTLVQFDAHLPTTAALVARTTGSSDFLILRGADASFAFDTALETALTSARSLHVSLFALSAEPGRNAVMTAIRAAHAAGIVISLDPTIRARIWAGMDEALRVIADVCPLATIVKPSLDDAEILFGAGQTAEQYIGRFHDLGARQIMLTLGKDGVLVSDGSRIEHVTAQPVTIVDAVGAGDSFMAGALLALVDGESLIDAARIGTIVAAHKLQVVGNLAPLPGWELVRQEARR